MSDLNKPISLEDLLKQLVAPGELSNTLAKTYKKFKIKTPLDLLESNGVLILIILQRVNLIMFLFFLI